MSECAEDLQKPTTDLERSLTKVRFREKAKNMKWEVMKTKCNLRTIKPGNGKNRPLPIVYLGNIMENNGNCETSINCRIGKVAAVFQKVRFILSSTAISN